MNPFDQETKEGLHLSPASINHLENTAKWARFMAILGFIGIGLMVIGALIMFVAGAALSSRGYGSGGYGGSYYAQRGPFGGIPMALIGVAYLLSAALYFFPVLYLHNFARRMLQAITLRDSASLESSFENLKNHYRFIGILTIIIIALYILAVLIMVAAGAAQGFR